MVFEYFGTSGVREYIQQAIDQAKLWVEGTTTLASTLGFSSLPLAIMARIALGMFHDVS